MKLRTVALVGVLVLFASCVINVGIWSERQRDHGVKIEVNGQRIATPPTWAQKAGSIRGIPQLSAAVTTYDHIDELKLELNPARNGYKQLEAVQRMMFIGDYVCATGGDCEQAKAAFDELKNAPKIETMEPAGLRQDLSGWKKLQKHQAALLKSVNPGYSNVLVTLRAGSPRMDPLDSQDFMDSILYVGMRTFAQGLISNEIAHSGIIQTKEWQKTVDDEVADITGLINAYRKIFEKRLGADYDTSALVMDQLDQLKLTNADIDLRIPCP